MKKKEQASFDSVKPEDVPLNGKQLDMLALLADTGAIGALVYGRGPTETVDALKARGLVEPADKVNVIVMGQLEQRLVWRLTAKGHAVFA